MSNFLIYGLKDPFTNEVRYIGRSCSGLKRPREHSCPLNLKKKKTHCVSWIKSLKGIKPIIEVLEYGNDSNHLDELEINWITKAKELGWKLTNHTEGGKGTKTFKHSEESKLKISIQAKRNWLTGNRVQFTEEVRFKCGSSMRGKNLSIIERNIRAKSKGTKSFEVFDIFGKSLGIFYNKSECSRTLKIDRKTIIKGLKNMLNKDYKYRFKEL